MTDGVGYALAVFFVAIGVLIGWGLRTAVGAEQVNVGVVAPYVIRKDFGGLIGEYLLRYRALENTPIIVDGECNSACTLVLANPYVCATDRGFFNFHAAYDIDTKLPRPASTALLWARYPAKVQEWITAHGGLTTKWIGTKAITFLPQCKEGNVVTELRGE